MVSRGTGYHVAYHGEDGGHYMDMGSCEKIAKGEIKVKGEFPSRGRRGD